jgi:hypothetical protein
MYSINKTDNFMSSGLINVQDYYPIKKEVFE